MKINDFINKYRLYTEDNTTLRNDIHSMIDLYNSKPEEHHSEILEELVQSVDDDFEVHVPLDVKRLFKLQLSDDFKNKNEQLGSELEKKMWFDKLKDNGKDI